MDTWSFNTLTNDGYCFYGIRFTMGSNEFLGSNGYNELIFGYTIVGESIVTWLWGGFSVDNPTLNRFFSLHFVLPFVIVGVVILHLVALHRFGSNNPIGIDVKGKQDTIPFHPYYTIKDLFGLSVFATIFAAAVFFFPNFMGHPDNYIPANPMVTPAHIVPEWYFLPFYAILRAIPDKLGGVLFMFGAIMVLFVLPWLDKSSVRSSQFRPLYKLFFWFLVIDCIALGYLGAMPAEGIYVVLSRLATAYYFFHFLIILPLLPKIESTRPLPVSISTPIITASSNASTVMAMREKK